MKNQTAEQAYDQKVIEISRMIARLNAAHGSIWPRPQDKKVHWGDVGTASKAMTELATACRTLGIITTKEARRLGAEY